LSCAFYKDGSAGRLANIRVETYPSSHHSFEFYFKDRWALTPRGQILLVSYNAKQAEICFEKTKAFFDKNLK